MTPAVKVSLAAVGGGLVGSLAGGLAAAVVVGGVPGDELAANPWRAWVALSLPFVLSGLGTYLAVRATL